MNRLAGHSDIERVRDATDLLRLIGEHVVLRPKGREHVGLCPFHADKNPSMAVVTHKGNAFYKCHSCGAGGDCFDFVMKYHRMDFGEALRLLADKAGVALTPWKREEVDDDGGPRRVDVKKANQFAATFFRRMLSDDHLGDAARAVIAARGITPAMAEAFMLGAAPQAWDGLLNRVQRQGLPLAAFVAAGLLKSRREGEGHYDAFRNRVIFPICDETGAPIAFGARRIAAEDEPKYLNSSESAVFNKSRTLYGLNLAKRAIIEKRTAIITEGYTDVIACHQAGVANVVATLGTALTHEHAHQLAKLCESVVLLFDGDEAGMKAADRALAVSFKEGLDIRICVLPDGLDPDELLKQRDGRDRFDAAIAAANDLFAYKVARFGKTLVGASVAGRERRLESLMTELAQMGFGAMQGVRQQMLLGRIDDLLRLPIGTSKTALVKTAGRQRTTASAPSVPIEGDAVTALRTDRSQHEVSRARCVAEFELLGLVIFEPALAQRLLGQIHGQQTPLEVLAPDRFEHPSSRVIATFVADRAADDASFSVQQLLDALPDAEDRRIASQLYFDGERLAGTDGQNLESALGTALSALEGCRRREHLQHVTTIDAVADSDPVQHLREILDHRRQAGQIASAIGRGARV